MVPGNTNNISLQSPNAIPPRTSSTGSTTPLPPARSVLRPVPESDWLSQHNRHRSSSTTTAITGMHATGPQDPARYESEDLNYTSRKTWTEQKEKVLVGPFDYLFAHPGKDFRTLMVNSFNAWLAVPQESLDVITKVVGMLHTASLLIDDVEDNSLLRRGLPVAHSIFGTAQTINSANYIYFCALQELQKLKNPKAISVYTEELLNLHRGQGMDLFWRDTLTCPTEEEYLEMVGNKTGGLFRLAIKLMQAESSTPIDCVPLVNILGILFQIQDDYRNLSSPEYGQNKGLCEDLTEGKFSFLIIHSIRSNPSNLQLLNILKQKTTDDEVKRYAVKYMESTGSFEYTEKVLAILIERARKMADELDAGRGKSIGIHKILDKLVIS
ncbi:isoprenoid synthase domain-containing protein [Annulohypoxylon maeteangense]|uniref:isoprenoid synthase domain-containing protein n=1 Tax=Annulohypoxylon maeteangense TaxID=1927788 RepID=UPI0020081875|nr:isoprenoid synthase domain-containing protein [Annulohypoxylon maeteangense]KAI0885538.1 isoprenoid synthase domain-containing protein [Annulohypoxylon maeteangense]